MSAAVNGALVDHISLNAHQPLVENFFRSVLEGMGKVMGDDPFGDTSVNAQLATGFESQISGSANVNKSSGSNFAPFERLQNFCLVSVVIRGLFDTYYDSGKGAL